LQEKVIRLRGQYKNWKKKESEKERREESK